MGSDRRVATIVWALAGATLVAAAVAGGPVATRPLVVVGAHDPAALAELVDRLEAGAAGSWIATYEYRRDVGRTPGDPGELVEGRDDGIHVEIGASTFRMEMRDDEYAFVCTLTDEGERCLEGDAADHLTAAQVITAAVGSGSYVVNRAPDVRAAGETARCYAVLAVDGYVPALGAITEHCLAVDGVPLRTLIAPLDHVDERVAVDVHRGPSDREFEALFRRLDELSERAPG